MPSTIGRRAVLHILAALTAFAARPAGARTRHVRNRVAPRTLYKGEMRKRFRKRAPRALRTNLEPGFYANPRSGVTHYVTPERTIVGVDVRMHTNALTPISWEKSKHFASGELPFATEQHALAVFRPEDDGSATPSTQQVDQAAEIILKGLDRLNDGKEATIPWRLYDLLLGLAIRYDRPVLIEDLIGAANRSRNRAALQQSIAVWKGIIAVLAQTPGVRLSPEVAGPANSRVSKWKNKHPVRWPLPEHRKPAAGARVKWIQFVV